MTVTLIVISVTTITLTFIWSIVAKNRRPKGFPPGPLSLPLIGNLYQLGWVAPWSNLVTIGKKYGGIFSVDYGSVRSIVVNDLKLLKQCLNDPALSGRPKFPVFLERTEPGAKYCRGILFTELRHWNEQRRFVLKSLGDFGFGKSSMEGIIQEEIQECLKRIRIRTGLPVVTDGLFSTAIVKALWKICAGSRSSQDDPTLAEACKLVTNLREISSPVIFVFPKLCEWFPEWTGYNSFISGHNAVNAFVAEEYRNHKATFVAGEPRDLMDALIEEVARTTDPDSSFYKDEGEASVIKSLEDLFLAGSETTSTMLTWVLLLMAVFPDMQEKLFNEITRVVGSERAPELRDRPNMPYTECVTMEVFRYVAPAPLSIWHSTTTDVVIGGYRIPKDTVFTPNLYAAMHDSEVWGDPGVFRPERFLNPDGTANKSHESFIPFSFGKRVCLGEKLAKEELFLFITSIFQNFRVTTNPGSPPPSLTPIPTVVVSPKPHELIFHER